MACGVPCVTTRVGDAEHLVGPCGIVVEPGDDAAITEAVAALLAEPAPARASRSEASRARICASFSVDALAHNTERLILDLGFDAAAMRALAGDP
jgi:glycosyltransferase involved in cell wall biosynthesis